jgi:ABC-type protease/lipase transport system fused ATPase/permease subunit
MNPLNHLKGLIAPFVLFSFVSNTAILVSPIFMMQVLDRVVPSGNLSTLFLLLLVAASYLLLNAFIEVQKSISQKRTSHWIEKIGADIALQTYGDIRQTAIKNVGLLKTFFKSSQITSVVNIPWIPLFVFALALIHPLFVVLIGGIIIALLAIKYVSEVLSKDNQSYAAELSIKEMQALSDAIDPKIVAGISAISDNLLQLYFKLQSQRHLKETAIATSLASQDAGANFVRTLAQLLSLSLGAALVVSGDLSAGGMIGASIIAAKTIQTIEATVNNLPEIRTSHTAFRALQALPFGTNTKATEVHDLSGKLTCKELIYPRGNGAPPRLDRVSLELSKGECLAIIGESGSGKTTLLHALNGLDPCPIGSVFLDETEVRTLGPESRKKSIGYLPQQAQLLSGTIAQNISCFAHEPVDENIIKAAKRAGVHGLISSLPQAYQTDMSQSSFLLSAGQKQRVALARAIYELPQYLFLDEPNALLDAGGERQLCDTLAALKAEGTSIIMVLHRSGIMGLSDKIAVLDNGRMVDFGARAEVLARMNDGKQRLTLPLNENSLQDLNDWITAQFMRISDTEFCQKAILVATEMFNTATQNGPCDVKREGTFVFQFVDQDHCEVILKEDRPTRAVDKMAKVRSLIKHPEVNMIDLPTDEISLAVLVQLADNLKVENIEKSSLFTANLASDKFKKSHTRVQ